MILMSFKYLLFSFDSFYKKLFKYRINLMYIRISKQYKLKIAEIYDELFF